MKDQGLRILRGWIGAFVCTGLAAASHTVADGGMPPLPILGLLLCLSAVVCTALASNKISLVRTSLAVMLSQGGYHGAFALFGHQHQVSGILNDTGGHTGHAGHVVELSLDPAVTASSMESVNGLMMPLAHLAAAVLSVLAIRRGELAASAFAEAIFLWVPRLIRFVRAAPATRGKMPLPGIAYRGLVLRDVLRPTLHRRGPPRGSAFAIS